MTEANTPMERIECGVRASIAWSIEHADYFRLVQFAATDERFSDGVRKGQVVAVKDAARHIEDAMAAGEIPHADSELLAQAMIGVHTRMVQLVHQGLLEPDAQAIDTTVGFCLYGITGPGTVPTSAADTNTAAVIATA